MVNVLVQVTDEEIRRNFPGFPITGTTRDVYVQSIKKVSCVYFMSCRIDDLIVFQKKRREKRSKWIGRNMLFILVPS